MEDFQDKFEILSNRSLSFADKSDIRRNYLCDLQELLTIKHQNKDLIEQKKLKQLFEKQLNYQYMRKNKFYLTA